MRTALGLSLAIALVGTSACSAPQAQPTPLPVRVAATPQPTPEPTVAPTAAPVAVPTTGGLATRSPLPLTGEFAVTANTEDRTLSVVPIGTASVAATVSLDNAPASVAAVPDSDTAVYAADGAAALGFASLNAGAGLGLTDAGGAVARVVAPLHPEDGAAVVIRADDNTIRPIDPSQRTLGEPLQLGEGPHAVSFGAAGAPAVQHIFVTSAGSGSVSVLDGSATSMQRTLNVGGQPVGVAETVDGRLWIADAAADSMVQIDPGTGRRLASVDLGRGLTGLAVGHDGHFLAASSSTALYAVDLLQLALAKNDLAVHRLPVPGGVLALAMGEETTRAYVTTGDGFLLYWDLAGNTIAQTVSVGHRPQGLAIGLVTPTGSASTPSDSAAPTGAGAGSGGSSSAGGSGTAGTTGVASATSAIGTTGASSATGATGATGAAGVTGASGATSTGSVAPVAPAAPAGNTPSGSSPAAPAASDANTNTGPGTSPGGTGGSSGTSGTSGTVPPSGSVTFTGGTSPGGAGTTAANSSATTAGTGATSSSGGTGTSTTSPSSSSSATGSTSPGTGTSPAGSTSPASPSGTTLGTGSTTPGTGTSPGTSTSPASPSGTTSGTGFTSPGTGTSGATGTAPSSP
jgi:YVTN family beta-propeller protein